MRISIKKHNQPYLQRLSAQMESDPTETINYLLTELRRVGYSFNSNVTLAVGGTQLSSTSDYQPFEEKAVELGSTGSLMSALEKDPLIERLISVGLDQF